MSQPHTDLGMLETNLYLPHIKDILEEDIAEEPEDTAEPLRGHHKPPMAEDPQFSEALF